MKTWKIVVAALLATSLLAACSGGDPGSDADATSTAPTATQTSDDNDDGGGLAPTELHLTAPVDSSNTGFTETTLSAPADTPFTIVFHNEDAGIPHNVQIFEGASASGTPVWAPEDNALINGPDEVTYEIPALPAGTYAYNCFVHPVTMVGTLTVA